MHYRTKKYTGVLLGLLALLPMACEDDIDPVVEELTTSRTFAPVGLEARVRNQVDIELSWTANAQVEQYVVEFFQDSLMFSGDPVHTATVEEIPASGTITYTGTFDGETVYSARVKAVTEGQEESHWATVATMTDPEQIFLPIIGPNVQDTYAAVQWAAGSDVTHFLIVPGNILIQISDAQKAAGEATIEGLAGGTDYTVTLYNGENRRGTVQFSTLKEANVTPLDDLVAIINAAEEGATLILASGEYNPGEMQIIKSITIEGQKFYDKPVITGRFTFGVVVSSVTVEDLDLRGGSDNSQAFNTTSADANIEELIIDGCEISGYSNNIIYNQSSGTYGSVTMRDSYVHDIPGGGGDGFDIRGGAFGSLTVENSTFTNGIRSFLRMQVPADVAFRNCTFYRVSIVASSNNRGLFRLSGGGGSLEVSNCLIVETGVVENGTNRGNWSTVGDISAEVTTTYSTNYYYNNIGLWEGQYTDPSQVDATEADPGFEDPANGDFTITNQTLIDEQVGDPKWWQ